MVNMENISFKSIKPELIQFEFPQDCSMSLKPSKSTKNSNNVAVPVSEQTDNFEVQAECAVADVHNVLSNIESSPGSEIDDVRCTLIDLFSKYATKRMIKQLVLGFLLKDPHNFPNIVHGTISLISEDMTKKISCNGTLCQSLIYFVETCLPSLKDVSNDIIEEALQFCNVLVGLYLHKVRSDDKYDNLSTLINAACRLVLLLYSRKKSMYYPTIAMSLLKNSYEILCEEIAEYDIRWKCGMMLIQSFYRIPEDEKKAEPLIFKCSINEIDNLTFTRKLLTVQTTETIKTIIYTAVSSAIDPLDIPIEEKVSVITDDYVLLTDSAERVTSIPEQIVDISKTLLQMSKYFQFYSADKFSLIFDRGLSHVWGFIDHNVQFVRNYTKDLFTSLIKIAAVHHRNGKTDCIDLLITKFSQMSKVSNIYFLAIDTLCNTLGTLFIIEKVPGALQKTMDLIDDPILGTQASNAYIEMMKKHFTQVSQEEWIAQWIQPIVVRLRNAESPTTECLENIIVAGCQIFPQMLHALFPPESTKDMKDNLTLLKCLHFARQLNDVRQDDEDDHLWRGLVEKSKLDLFAMHQNDQIRLSVLSVLVESKKSTEFYTAYDLEFLTKFLKYNIAASSPSTRKQIISLYKKALARFDASSKVIAREIASMKKEGCKVDSSKADIYEKKIKLYNRFIFCIIQDSICNLFAGANYPRRATTLELLIIAQQYVPSDEWNSCWSKRDVDNLLNTLRDSYENNKLMALNLLGTLPPDKVGPVTPEETQIYFHQSCDMACDIKPVNTLTAAYMFQFIVQSPHLSGSVTVNNASGFQSGRVYAIWMLLGKLSAALDESKGDVLVAASSKPLHGILLCVHYLIKTRDKTNQNHLYTQIFSDLVSKTNMILKIVNPIICNQSPEGYLPKDELLDHVDQTSTAQLILFYAWRTMKELTLLLAEIVVQSCQIRDLKLLLDDELNYVLQAFVDIFLQTKHRGVFEQAYVGFSSICEAFWRSDDERYPKIPNEWLSKTLGYCIGKEKNSMLCPTRRSAGLPFLLLSVVTTHPNINKTFMDGLMLPLLEGAENEDNETKTHCLNTLRAIFRNAKLGDYITPYIVKAVQISILGFRSQLWAVRNSSTLLYSALIVRIFGVQRSHDPEELTMKNKLTVKVFIMRYPGLLEFLIDTLSKECGTNNDDGNLLLHPILLIMSRLCPSHGDHLADKARYLSVIEHCLSHSIYKTRVFAARASLAFIAPEDIPSIIDEKFQLISEQHLDGNTLCGYLTQLIYLLKRVPSRILTNVRKYVSGTFPLLKYVGHMQKDFAATLYMDVLRKLLIQTETSADFEILDDIIEVLCKKENFSDSTLRSRYTCNKNRLLLYMSAVFKMAKYHRILYNYLADEIMHYVLSQDAEMKKYCLKILIYLSQSMNEKTFGIHTLIEYDQLDIPTGISEVIDSADKLSKVAFSFQMHDHIVAYCSTFFESAVLDEDNLVESLLLCMNFTCFVNKANGSLEGIFKKLMKIIQTYSDCDEVVSATLSCLSVMLSQANKEKLRLIKMEEVIHILEKSASTNSPEHLRMVVCQFLTNFKPWKYDLLNEKELRQIFNIMMSLLEDDDLEIRNAMSLFGEDNKSWQPIPERAREDLFDLCFLYLQKSRGIVFIIDVCTRTFDIENNDMSEIFDRSELNQHADKVAIAKSAAVALRQQIWPKSQKLLETDPEECALEAAVLILRALQMHREEFIGNETIIELIFILKHIVHFIGDIEADKDFHLEFTKFLRHDVQSYFIEHSPVNGNITIYLLLEIFRPVIQATY